MELIQLSLAGFIVTLLTLDLTLKWRNRHGALEDVTDWKGLIPLPALAVVGGLSSLVCGWVGWGLLITAGLASADTIKVIASPGVGWERAIVIRSTMIFQAATIAMGIRAAVQLSMSFV